ncbi:MAG: cohesin domain-containing protein [Candidatus Omnitrophica bacterium]|nr:cohesin domain-containing protein [Candidatus Omnitrophota bacterium]
MRKKFLILIFLLISISFAAIVEIPSITINNPSQTFVDVNISFSSEKNFTGYQLTIQYNHQVLKILDVQKGPAVSLFTVMTNTNTPGTIRIAGFNPTLSGVSGNGILAILKFQIVNPGYSNLILSSVKLSDANGQTIPCSASSGFIRTDQSPQKPEKLQPQRPPEETKPKEKPVPVTVRPTAKSESDRSSQKLQESQPPLSTLPENLDIDELLTLLEMEKTETKETRKEIPRQKPGDIVTLLVLSDYGNPYPGVGVTSFTKGEKVNCQVESEILISDTEKVVCIGCEGKGSAFNTKNNTLSFVIDRDSKIIWKWKKLPVEPGILIETENEIRIDSSKKQISVPIKIRFLGNFNKPIYIQAAAQNFDATLTETCLTPQKNQSTLILHRKDDLSAGSYILELLAQSEDKKTIDKKKINIISYGYASAGETIIDETSIKIPLRLTGLVKNISSFGINLKLDRTIRFIAIETLPDIKVLSGQSYKGSTFEIKGGCVPSFNIKDGTIFTLVLNYSKDFSPDMVKIIGFSLWDDRGESIPILYLKQ